MSDQNVNLGVLKLGCIGASPLIDLLLDERADREDLHVRAFTSGASGKFGALFERAGPSNRLCGTRQCLGGEQRW